jgi:peptidase C39-like protein
MPPSRARAVLAVGAASALAAPLLLSGAASAATPPRPISYRQWDTTAQLRTGSFSGTSVAAGRLRLTRPSAHTTIRGRSYVVGTWTSPSVRPGFALTELVPSWAATTPAGTLVQVDVRGVGTGGRRSSWDTLGRWASGDATFRRTSLGSQRDDLASVATDTWEANRGGLRSWQLRVSLLRRTGARTSPLVDTIGAMGSALPHVARVTRSRPGVARGRVLPVPRYSQMVHAGQYPRYGGGGEAWCSPTATTMVLAYYRRLPPASAYAWVNRSYVDRVVDHSARMTFDYGYDGTGNWPFNTAYAARHTGHAFVTRFASLRDVERFIRAGIPVVTSITFGRGELSGAPIGATNGHLVVVVGFTSAGNVVVNDPAARTRAGVRRTYARGQFESAWLKRYPAHGGMRGSGGLAYVVRDGRHPLPARAGRTSW